MVDDLERLSPLRVELLSRIGTGHRSGVEDLYDQILALAIAVIQAESTLNRESVSDRLQGYLCLDPLCLEVFETVWIDLLLWREIGIWPERWPKAHQEGALSSR